MSNFDLAGRGQQLSRPFESVVTLTPSDDAQTYLTDPVRGFESVADGLATVIMADGATAQLYCLAGHMKPFSIIGVKETGTDEEITAIVGGR